MADDQPLNPPASTPEVVRELVARFGEGVFQRQATVDGVPTLWVDAGRILEVLRYLKTGVPQPYRMLYDLTAVDERMRKHRAGLPARSWSPPPGPRPCWATPPWR